MLHYYTTRIQGTYKPTLFALSINKQKVLNENMQISDEFGNIFVHEYIHFLQDILTGFGLRNIAKLARQYSLINQEIIQLPGPAFTIPYVPQDPTLKIEKEKFEILWGTESLSMDEDFEVIDIEKQANLINLDHTDLPFISVAIWLRDSAEREEFHLGAIHFMEGMTYLIETAMYPGNDDYPDFPYRVVEKIVKSKLTGDVGSRNLILMMEAALESHTPALYFYYLIQFCKEREFSLSEDVLNDYNSSYKFYWNGKRYSRKEFYFANAALCREGFMALFNHEKLQPLNLWARTLIGNAIKLKRAGFSFTDLLPVNANFNPARQVLGRLIKRLGTPVMTDQGYGIFLLAPNNVISEHEMVYLLGLEAVIEVISGNRICSMLPYCANDPNGDITNDDCYQSP